MITWTSQRARLFAFCSVAFASSLLWSQVEPDQPAIAPYQWKGGYNGFAMLCRLNGLLVHESYASWRNVDPKKSIMVVLGDIRRFPGNAFRYVRNGGALLVASDRSNGIFAPWGVEFNGGPVAAQQPEDNFRGLAPFLPLVSPDPDLPSDHPLAENWNRLAANRSGSLRMLSGMRASLRTVARLPGGRRPGAPFVIAMEGNGSPQALFIADQSIFTNQMLSCESNAAFAQASLRWLASGERTDILIVSNNIAISPMQPDRMLLPPPNPKDVIDAISKLPPEKLLEFANVFATTVEDNGAVDEALADMMEQMTPRQERALLRFVVVMATILLALWLLFRLFNRRTDQRSPSSKSDRSEAMQMAIERRQAAIVLLDQLRSDLALGGTLAWQDVLQQLAPTRATARFRKEVNRALSQVYRRSLNVWTTRRLKRLEQQVTAWRQQVDQGEISLALQPMAP